MYCALLLARELSGVINLFVRSRPGGRKWRGATEASFEPLQPKGECPRDHRLRLYLPPAQRRAVHPKVFSCLIGVQTARNICEHNHRHRLAGGKVPAFFQNLHAGLGIESHSTISPGAHNLEPFLQPAVCEAKLLLNAIKPPSNRFHDRRFPGGEFA